MVGATWDGNNYGSVEMQNYNNIYRFNATYLTEIDFLQTWAPLHQWFHITWVASSPNTTTWTSTYTVYVNGQPVVRPTKNQFRNGPGNVMDATQMGIFPMPITRWYNYLAASVWGDPPASYLLDAFRVYDYALTQTQVQAMATSYGLNSAAPIPTTPPVQTNLNIPAMTEDQVAATLVPRPALFNGSFALNPQPYVAPSTGATLNYQWLQFDPMDSLTVAGKHQGLIVLSGAVGSYIDLGTNQGANSVGMVMPTIGGAGFYPFGDPRQGMSFELVIKLNATSTWAKIACIGDGAGVDDVVIGWDGNDYGRLSLQNLNNAALTPAYVQFMIEMIRAPVLGQWYHLVVTAQAVNATLGTANWQVYVNGVLQNWTSALSPGISSTFSAFQGGTWPQPVSRYQSYLGKSDWGDPYLAATFDAFRYYDYLLDPTSVRNLANMYGLYAPVAPPTSYSFPPPPRPPKSRTSSLRCLSSICPSPRTLWVRPRWSPALPATGGCSRTRPTPARSPPCTRVSSSSTAVAMASST